jgi:hypothetical protein
MGLTFLAIAEFTYFLGRSHQNNLFYISIPAICAASYWMMRISFHALRIPVTFRHSVRIVWFAGLVALFIVVTPLVRLKADATLAHSLLRARAWAGPDAVLAPSPSDTAVTEALYLINKYTASTPRIALFLSPEFTTEALFLARKANVFPTSNPIQDAISASAQDRALHFQTGLKAGDIIFVDENYMGQDIGDADMKAVQEFERKLVDRLRREFTFEEIERTPYEIAAIRLKSQKYLLPFDF